MPAKLKPVIRGKDYKTFYIRIPPEIVKALNLTDETQFECKVEGNNIIYIIIK